MLNVHLVLTAEAPLPTQVGAAALCVVGRRWEQREVVERKWRIEIDTD